MMTIPLLFPTQGQTPAQQMATLEQALRQITQAVNQNASTPLSVVHQPSTTLSQSASTSAGAAVYQQQSIVSRGGLVNISGSISASGSGYVGLAIDGATVLQVPTASGTLQWNGVLSAGSHTIAVVYGASSGTVTINPSGFTSNLSIIENPANVQS